MTKKPKPAEQSAMQAEVMGKIHSGSVRMKPRIYFTVLWLLGIAATLAASLTFAYLISMLFYIIRIQTASTPAYGARHNLSEAIASFPWWSVILAISFTVVAIWLMRKYSRIYRYKVSIVITTFVLISLLVGLLLSFADLGHSVNQAERSKPSNGHVQDGSGRGPRMQK